MSIYVTHSNSGRIIYLSPVEELTDIEVVYESENFDAITIDYSYAFDNVTWSEWFSNKQEFLDDYSNNQEAHVNIYVKVRIYSVKGTQSLSFSSLEVKCVEIDSNIIEVCQMEMVNLNDVILRTNTKNLYNPYNQLSGAHTLNRNFSKAVSDIFGFECTYFRTEPVQDSRNITFKTYALSEVIEYKPLKILIKDNQLPDNRFQYSEFEIDFQDELEVHIVIEEFNNIFGESFEPNADDYLYLPLTGRMYQVNTVYENKKFMNTATYYRATLVTWEDRADVIDDNVLDKIDDFADFIDNFEEEKIDIETKDAIKEFNDVQEYDNTFNITEFIINKNGNTVLKYLYNTSGHDEELSYDLSNITNNEYSLNFWFKYTNDNLFDVSFDDDSVIKADVNSFGNVVITYNTTESVQTLTTIGTPLNKNSIYFVNFNYSFTSVHKLISCTIIDGEFNNIQENFNTLINQLNNVNTLSILSNMSGNIRVSKNIITQNNINEVACEYLPSYNDNYIIDNAVPPLIEGSNNC